MECELSPCLRRLLSPFFPPVANPLISKGESASPLWKRLGHNQRPTSTQEEAYGQRRLIAGDITELHSDPIVNASNTSLGLTECMKVRQPAANL